MATSSTIRPGTSSALGSAARPSLPASAPYLFSARQPAASQLHMRHPSWPSLTGGSHLACGWRRRLSGVWLRRYAAAYNGWRGGAAAASGVRLS